ncbi:MSHA biogenesis protein MshJ [Cellvibrio fontiphilus]|uniref:MSHA biogenesis protein MshJ n=1 Tax=Cellvibrio fontiphilus TaxID=1815559 RepID=A0ABV7FC17_9GAMM
MPAALQKLMEQIDARVLRERVLIFLTLLAVVFLIWQLLVQSAIDKTSKSLEAERAKITKEQQDLETKITTLSMAMASDPAIAKRKDIDKLRADISDVEGRLAGLSQGLISAEQLPKVLQDVLARTANIQLREVRTLPVMELQLDPQTVAGQTNKAGAQSASSATNQTPVAGTGVYKHSVIIRVSGSYLELLNLLRAIEALEWKFYWESLDYTVKNYPNAEIDIEVFTLSSEEGLFGV